MRAKKAKAIRREVYGDLSIKAPRSYAINPRTGQIIVQGLRALYQQVKRDYKRGIINVV